MCYTLGLWRLSLFLTNYAPFLPKKSLFNDNWIVRKYFIINDIAAAFERV